MYALTFIILDKINREKEQLEKEIISSRQKHSSVQEGCKTLANGVKELKDKITSLTDEVTSYHDLLQEEKDRREKLQRQLEELQVCVISNKVIFEVGRTIIKSLNHKFRLITRVFVRCPLQVQKSSLEDHIKDQQKKGDSQLNDLRKAREQIKELELELSTLRDKTEEKEGEMSALNTEKENLQDEVNLMHLMKVNFSSQFTEYMYTYISGKCCLMPNK